ncbi:BTAD domain-containing putative transcriptional regulator [Micromonospora echinospora]|uniref:DNA-binding SARP family transcriptional activator/Tfp pilus assembly protein PilF n=1 Tax=Micromonospora echinospora TaxID=1877 RepID=A0ABR6MEB9_MICEC|nr:BTAD domain-containing putative transcriptional regulator [Micromonospora echinospora]MBB5113724.1 DNA-binding SARP family transcriptional activator/Tfp pilus assembly protein PilF [Micromonospora echinospora]
MAVEFRVLGDLDVRVDGRAVRIGHARQQCVLAALLVEPNRVVAAGQLISRVWGDEVPDGAAATLRGYLSRLRQALAGADEVRIVRRHPGYLLAVDPDRVDLHRFRALTEQARRAGDDVTAIGCLERALGLWRGEAFDGLTTPWLAAYRQTLDRQRLAAALDRNDIAMRRGAHARLLPDVLDLSGRYPWDERLAAQAMLALYRCGRQADALEHFHRLRRRLAAEIGADPSPPLAQLYQQILTADAAVAPPQFPEEGEPAAAATGPSPGGARDAGAVPRQLPASPGVFAGRTAQLARLDEQLGDAGRPDGAGPPVVISSIGGGGGVGKTWLALRWAHANTDRFPDGQLYVNLRGFDPASEPVKWPVAVRGFLEALGVEPARVPADPEAQASLYRTLVAGRRLLVVLDDARDAATVIPLLPGTPTSAVLVTSRRQLAGLVTTHGARPLPLDVLPDDEARELIVRQVGAARVAGQPDAVADILGFCGGLPLALGIVAARAALNPELALSSVAAELTSAVSPLDALAGDEVTTNLRVVLSRSLAALTPAAAEVFALLGLAPGPDIGRAAAASMTARTPDELRPPLRELVDAHLVQQHVAGRYRMHDLVRSFAVERASGDPAGSRSALRRLVDHHLHTAHAAALLLSPQRDPLTLAPAAPWVTAERLDDLAAALAWFTGEHQVLLAIIEYAAGNGLDVATGQLSWTLATYFDRQGHWHDWAAVARRAVEATGRSGDRPAQAQAHRLLAGACSNLGRHAEAQRNLLAALDLFAALGDDEGRAHTHFDLSMLHDRQRQPREALPHARQSLALYERVGSPLKQAVALNAIGWYHSQLGEHHDAITFCRRALALSEQAGSAYGQANTWDSIGFAHHHLGEYEQAVDCFQQALALFAEIGDRHAEGIVLDHLGDTWAAAGRADAARDAWRRSLALYEELGHADAEAVRRKLHR